MQYARNINRIVQKPIKYDVGSYRIFTVAPPYFINAAASQRVLRKHLQRESNFLNVLTPLNFTPRCNCVIPYVAEIVFGSRRQYIAGH